MLKFSGFSVYFTIISFQIFKFFQLFSIFYNHFFWNLQILGILHYLLQSFPFESSNSPDFSVSFTTISFPIFKFSGLFIIFYNHFFSNRQIRRTFLYLLQLLFLKSPKSPDFSVFFTIISFKSPNSPDFSAYFTIISFQISKFSGLFSIFYNHFPPNLHIFRTFHSLLQSFLL